MINRLDRNGERRVIGLDEYLGRPEHRADAALYKPQLAKENHADTGFHGA